MLGRWEEVFNLRKQVETSVDLDIKETGKLFSMHLKPAHVHAVHGWLM